MKKQPSTIKQFSQFFQVPVLTLYVIIAALIVLAGVFAGSGAVQREQRVDSLAGSSPEAPLNCNEACSHNHQCAANHFCYNGRCRLVTIPNDPNCGKPGEPTQPIPDKGEPPVIQPTTPPPAPPDTTTELPGCNQPCVNNDECPPNFFCYQARCRLVTSPQDPNCGVDAPTAPVVTEPTAQPTQPIFPTTQPATPATQPGVPFIPFTPEPEPETATGVAGLINEFFAESDTSIFFVLGLGVVGLIILVAIVTFISSRKKIEYQPADFTGLENNQTPSEKNQPQSANNQGNNQTIPINPSAETADANDQTQPTYQEDPDSSMVSRLKQKQIEIPQEEMPPEKLTPEELPQEETPPTEIPQKEKEEKQE